MQKGVIFARYHGFSLVELVVIIVLTAILAITVIPRIAGIGDISARGYYDELSSAMRYAQKLAVASGCAIRVAVTSGDYALSYSTPCNSTTFGTPVPHPARAGDFAASAPSGIAISAGTGDYDFLPNGGVSLGGNITVSGNGFSKSLQVHATTGYIEIQ